MFFVPFVSSKNYQQRYGNNTKIQLIRLDLFNICYLLLFLFALYFSI